MVKKKYLIDTHCLLWFQGDFKKIPQKVLVEIQDPDNLVFFSQLSLFEIAIKQKIGKLPDLKSNVNEIYLQAIKDDFTFLNIQNQHIFQYQKIPLHKKHRDPFDILLISTAVSEDAIIITCDKKILLYTGVVRILW